MATVVVKGLSGKPNVLWYW